MEELTVSVLFAVAFIVVKFVVVRVEVCMVEFTAKVFVDIVEPARVE